MGYVGPSVNAIRSYNEELVTVADTLRCHDTEQAGELTRFSSTNEMKLPTDLKHVPWLWIWVSPPPSTASPMAQRGTVWRRDVLTGYAGWIQGEPA